MEENLGLPPSAVVEEKSEIGKSGIGRWLPPARVSPGNDGGGTKDNDILAFSKSNTNLFLAELVGVLP